MKKTTLPKTPTARALGEIVPEEIQPDAAPWLPPEIRSGVTMPLPYEEDKSRNGLHKIRILCDTFIYSRPVKKGDEAEVPGGVAFDLITNRRAESLDPRKGRESELRKEAAALKIDLSKPVRENPVFQPRRRRSLLETDTI